MKLTDISKRISSQHKAAEKRLKETNDESLQQWFRGYLQALKEVSEFIKREQDIERMEQRLEKLRSEQLDEPEPDVSKVAEDVLDSANSNDDNGVFAKLSNDQKVA